MHEMVLDVRTGSGEEVWACPSCERRLLIHWTPQFRRTVLQGGEERVQHTGARGGAALRTVSVHGRPPDAELRWLQRSGIDWHGLAEPDARSA
jgi:hypothetical protein